MGFQKVNQQQNLMMGEILNQKKVGNIVSRNERSNRQNIGHSNTYN
jgi:hypothetical protein